MSFQRNTRYRPHVSPRTIRRHGSPFAALRLLRVTDWLGLVGVVIIFGLVVIIGQMFGGGN